MKLLLPYNSVSQHELKNLYSSQNSICNDIKLRQFIERDNSRTRSQVGPWTT
ncbi:25737_t:CDS:1, partial [Gigaspora rosea]